MYLFSVGFFFGNIDMMYNYNAKITIPTIIRANPIFFLRFIFSFKKMKLSTAMNMYPVASKIGPKERGIFE